MHHFILMPPYLIKVKDSQAAYDSCAPPGWTPLETTFNYQLHQLIQAGRGGSRNDRARYYSGMFSQVEHCTQPLSGMLYRSAQRGKHEQ